VIEGKNGQEATKEYVKMLMAEQCDLLNKLWDQKTARIVLDPLPRILLELLKQEVTPKMEELSQKVETLFAIVNEKLDNLGPLNIDLGNLDLGDDINHQAMQMDQNLINDNQFLNRFDIPPPGHPAANLQQNAGEANALIPQGNDGANAPNAQVNAAVNNMNGVPIPQANAAVNVVNGAPIPQANAAVNVVNGNGGGANVHNVVNGNGGNANVQAQPIAPPRGNGNVNPRRGRGGGGNRGRNFNPRRAARAMFFEELHRLQRGSNNHRPNRNSPPRRQQHSPRRQYSPRRHARR
jgi:hypothetical protein